MEVHGNEKKLVKSRFVDRVWLIILSLSRTLKKSQGNSNSKQSCIIDVCSDFTEWTNRIAKTVSGK